MSTIFCNSLKRMDKSLVTTPAHEELQKYCKTNISELSRKLKELEKSAN